MDGLVKFLNDTWSSYSELNLYNKCLVGATVSFAIFNVSTTILQKLSNIAERRKLADDPRSSKYDPNKIYLHVFPRKILKNVPNSSPFVVKVETWLRFADVKYEAIETIQPSRSTQQTPYIFHKGKEIADSDFIIEYLQNEYGMDLTEGLTPAQQATSRAYTAMVDERTMWANVLHRVCYEFENFSKVFSLGLPKLFETMLMKKIRASIAEKTKVIGIGRKSSIDVYKIGKEDIRAISRYLGDSQFMMGENMTKVDCVLFAHLSQIMYVQIDSPFKDLMNEECTNIPSYLERIKKISWPDWDDIVST